MKSAYELATCPSKEDVKIMEKWSQEQRDEHLSQLMTELEQKIKAWKEKLPWNQVQKSTPEPVAPEPIQSRVDEEPDFSEYRHLDLRY